MIKQSVSRKHKRLKFILYSAYIHLKFILYSSYIHLIFILYSSYIHLIFILYSAYNRSYIRLILIIYPFFKDSWRYRFLQHVAIFSHRASRVTQDTDHSQHWSGAGILGMKKSLNKYQHFYSKKLKNLVSFYSRNNNCFKEWSAAIIDNDCLEYQLGTVVCSCNRW